MSLALSICSNVDQQTTGLGHPRASREQLEVQILRKSLPPMPHAGKETKRQYATESRSGHPMNDFKLTVSFVRGSVVLFRTVPEASTNPTPYIVRSSDSFDVVLNC
jgi:hypothetical protein